MLCRRWRLENCSSVVTLLGLSCLLTFNLSMPLKIWKRSFICHRGHYSLYVPAVLRQDSPLIHARTWPKLSTPGSLPSKRWRRHHLDGNGQSTIFCIQNDRYLLALANAGPTPLTLLLLCCMDCHCEAAAPKLDAGTLQYLNQIEAS